MTKEELREEIALILDDFIYESKSSITGFIDKILEIEIFKIAIDMYIQKKCIWDGDIDNNYSTSCKNIFSILNGTPSENDMKYCPYCGRKIKESKNE